MKFQSLAACAKDWYFTEGKKLIADRELLPLRFGHPQVWSKGGTIMTVDHMSTPIISKVLDSAHALAPPQST
jgi:hypothetical protein